MTTQQDTDSSLDNFAAVGPSVKVRLRIVGLFLKETVELSGPGPFTVKQVMDAYIDQTNTFNENKPDADKRPQLSYSEEVDASDGTVGPSFLDSLSVTHYAPFESATKRHYPKGLYTLDDPLFARNSNGIPVWQYYVRNIQAQPESSANGFVPFARAQFDMKTGWSIIWRCVVIVTSPSRTINPKVS